jgi:hypothetical protein
MLTKQTKIGLCEQVRVNLASRRLQLLRICKNLYPNLSQYAANRAQTVQSQPNGVFSFHQLTSEPDAITRFAKPFWGPKPPTGVRIPPSPPEFP